MEIQDAENAVREIGTAAIDAVQGLDSATIEGSLPFIAGVLILLIAVKFLSLRLSWYGTVLSARCAVAGKPYRCSRGFGLKITVAKALIAGISVCRACLRFCAGKYLLNKVKCSLCKLCA